MLFSYFRNQDEENPNKEEKRQHTQKTYTKQSMSSFQNTIKKNNFMKALDESKADLKEIEDRDS